ncbi:MAG: Ni/Fe-hydrogenase, b-type cytochrome subunit [Rhodocyclaceae bacterium]|nr:Ni/Fe-hydrogenase, b-type cytochrome subunit [Rhodocyclaceae bacterium]
MTTHHAPSPTGVDDDAVARAPSLKSIYVYEAPVRLWHWVNALAIVVLAVSGYFIGSPPPSVPGEASDNFLFGYIRFAHFAAAYVFAVGFLARLYWGLVGNDHSRELFSIPVLTGAYWREIGAMLKWYAFLRPYPNRYVGHNPLARISMFFAIFLGGIFMLVTGFALYGEGAQAGHWSHTLFTSWVLPLFGQSQTLHTWHHLGMWMIVLFVMVHVYAAVREDIMGRQSMISTMLSGYRMFKK